MILLARIPSRRFCRRPSWSHCSLLARPVTVRPIPWAMNSSRQSITTTSNISSSATMWTCFRRPVSRQRKSWRRIWSPRARSRSLSSRRQPCSSVRSNRTCSSCHTRSSNSSDWTRSYCSRQCWSETRSRCSSTTYSSSRSRNRSWSSNSRSSHTSNINNTTLTQILHRKSHAFDVWSCSPVEFFKILFPVVSATAWLRRAISTSCSNRLHLHYPTAALLVTI